MKRRKALPVYLDTMAYDLEGNAISTTVGQKVPPIYRDRLVEKAKKGGASFNSLARLKILSFFALWKLPKKLIFRGARPVASKHFFWRAPLRTAATTVGYSGIAASSGSTGLTLNDDNLSDGIGLDSSLGVLVTLPSGASQTVSLTTMLSKLADTNANGGAGINYKGDIQLGCRSKKFLAPLLPSWTGPTTWISQDASSRSSWGEGAGG